MGRTWLHSITILFVFFLWYKVEMFWKKPASQHFSRLLYFGLHLLSILMSWGCYWHLPQSFLNLSFVTTSLNAQLIVSIIIVAFRQSGTNFRGRMSRHSYNDTHANSVCRPLKIKFKILAHDQNWMTTAGDSERYATVSVARLFDNWDLCSLA